MHLYLRELSNLQNLGIVDCDDEGASVSPGVVSIMSEALHWKQFDTYQTSGMWQIGGSEPWLDMQRLVGMLLVYFYPLKVQVLGPDNKLD